MRKYLEIFEEFKDIKEISDLIEDVNKLRLYYRTQNYTKMQEHIASLMLKYFNETIAWNTVNKDMPTNNDQSYINAENFLATQGAKKIAELVTDYKERLSHEESAFIESMTKLKE